MADDKDLIWEKGLQGDDLLLKTREGEPIAHIFPRDGHPGSFTMVSRPHGGWWGDVPGRHGTKLECQHYAMEHGQEYFKQEERNLSAMSRHHAIQNIEEQWRQMGGDPRTMNKFRKEWDRVSAAEHNLKVPDRDQGHER
ncbi:hypothetical protein [Nitrosomonas sp.]|uniref:hypothetical protein n=1 Tax=Nitrosomonas sp. TaxID=42353 RepID=UPI00283B6143|nr:hypothetical protein [Nitrosomonas sp.]MDR4515744.1 hypothetical protein [Nitrosomonas sp.]